MTATPVPPLDRDEVDRILVGLGAAHDQLAAAMYGLDTHAGLAFLRSTELAGRTKERFGELEPRVDLLWGHFNALGEILEKARAVRARRSRPNDEDLAELAALLRAPAIGLDASGMPTDANDPAPLRRIGVAELVPAAEASSAGLLSDLSDVDAAVTAVVGRIEAQGEALTRARELAAELVDPALADELGALAARLATARERELADPLGAAPAGALNPDAERRFAALDTELAAVADRLAELVRLRDGWPDRVAALSAAIDAAGSAEADAADSYRTAAEKIADPGLPPVPERAEFLRRRAGALERLGDDRQWTRLADELARLEHEATEAAAGAGRLRDAAAGLLDRRTELRGRLEAYRAKAARHGLAEDPALSERHREAQQLLYRAPCDLPAATRAVFRYQQELADVLGRRQSGRGE